MICDGLMIPLASLCLPEGSLSLTSIGAELLLALVGLAVSYVVHVLIQDSQFLIQDSD